MNEQLVREVQTKLQAKGYHVNVDGDMGDETLTAMLLDLEGSVAAVTKRLAWGKKVSPRFRAGVYWIADQFGWNAQGPSNLMSCMAWESDETFSPSKLNYAGSGATGLIQFMPKTAGELKTTTSALAAMTAEQQLGYVYHYLKQFRRLRGPTVDLADMYMSILLPSMIGRPANTPMFQGETIQYRQNSGLDANRDKIVTKQEAAAKVYAKLERGNSPEFAFIG